MGGEGEQREPKDGACPGCTRGPGCPYLPSRHPWGPQTHCDPQVSPPRVIQAPSLLLLKPGFPLRFLPVTPSLTTSRHFLSWP